MSLDELRKQLAAIDREILTLAARRQALAGEIGETKRLAGRPTRDYDQERDVVQNGRALAGQLGLAPDTAEELLLTLIRSSLTVQERGRVSAAAGGSGRRVLVIGGAGKMGRWMTRFLESQGFRVEIADPAGPVAGVAHHADWRAMALDHDFIVVAASLHASGEILQALAERRPVGIVFDIGSLKSPLRSGLLALRDAGVSVSSLHPMFGPDTELLTGRHVIVVDVGVPAANAAVRELFQSTMAIQVDMELDRHDRLIAYVLGLSHALNIAFFTALAESGEAAPQLALLSSTTFDAQLDIATRVANENPHLYYEIQSLNDHGGDSLSALVRAADQLRTIVRAGDEASFVALMEQGRTYLKSRPRGAERAP
jgi:chorismate mutase / prephenate dehydrogenase